MKRALWICACLMSVCIPGFSQGMTADDWYRLNRITDVQLSPDGRMIAYSMTRADRESQKNVTHTWVVAFDGRSDPRPFVTGFPAENHPRYSPDGERLAFIASKTEGERPQIYVARTSGGEATRISNLENGVNDFVWSPDSRYFAVVSRTGKHEDRNDPLAGVTVVDHLHYAQDGRGLLKDQRSHVFVVDVATGGSRQITEGDFDDSEPAWSPDSKAIAFVSDRTGKAFDGSRNTDVYIVAAEGGTPRKISPQPEANGSPQFSPDGKSIAFAGVASEGGQSDIYTMPVTGGTPLNLTEAFDERISRFVWTPSGMYFTTSMKGETPLFKLDPASRKIDKLVAPQGTQVNSFSLSKEGVIAVARSGFRHPADVFVGAGPGTAPTRHVTDVNRQLLSERTMAAAEEFKYKAADGMDLEGWLVKPLPFDPARKYPLILKIHGGPSGMWGTNFDHEMHVLSARGYAVLFVNPRGSSGYGQAFVRANNKDWAGKDYTDIMKGLDTALAQNTWIDPQRLAVYGCSYGGYMTNWIITQTSRFAAAAPECGMTDMVTLWGTTDGANSPEEAFGGSPWETFDLWWGRSPLKFAEKVKTPALFIHGEQDNRVPIAQAEQMFRALKRHGVETEFVRYPGESHGEFTNGKPAHYVDRIERVLAWFDKYTSASKSGSN